MTTTKNQQDKNPRLTCKNFLQLALLGCESSCLLGWQEVGMDFSFGWRKKDSAKEAA